MALRIGVPSTLDVSVIVSYGHDFLLAAGAPEAFNFIYEATLFSTAPFTRENTRFASCAFVICDADSNEGSRRPVLSNLRDCDSVLVTDLAHAEHVHGKDDSNTESKSLHEATEP